MRRGEIWTVSGGPGYVSKPRPVAIVQEDNFDMTDSITVCAFTTEPTNTLLLRIPIAPSELNGLRSPSHLMLDKITTVPKSKVGERIGRLDDEDIARLNRSMMVFPGLTVSPRARLQRQG